MIYYLNQLLAYFTFEGRMSRAAFIRACLVYSIILAVILLFGVSQMESSGMIDRAINAAMRGDNPQDILGSLQPTPGKMLFLLACYFILLPGIVRRLKDLGWSPLWGATALYFHTCLLTFAGLLGLDANFSGDWIFSVIEMVLMTLLTIKHGQAGTNAYGLDPLAPKKRPSEVPYDRQAY